MEMMSIVLITVIVLLVVFKLGLFRPIVEMAEVATRESAVYNRGHKIEVAKRYEKMEGSVNSEKVNSVIAQIDALDFD
jgi:hypothetical protein